jgi:uncharacterized iron-regulated protein
MSGPLRRGVLTALLPALVSVSSLAQQRDSPQLALALDPIAAIIEKFRTYSVVGLGEPHGNEQAHAFRLALIRDARFARTVNDIVVEFGAAQHQSLIDRFVRGDDVSDRSLRQVWQDTTQGHTVWDVPIYEGFFRAVRTVNISLPRERQLRVLLGDPPTDWDNVRTWDDVARPMADYNRDRHVAAVIQRDVLAKQRRALIIYGDGHLWRKAPFPTLMSLLEHGGKMKAFTVASSNMADMQSVQADVVSWRVPSLAIVRGTPLGESGFGLYYPLPGDAAQWRDVRLQDQFDAIIYYGPRSSLTSSKLAPTLCLDSDYMRMRLRRLTFLPPGAPNLGERLTQYCASVAPR